MFVLVIELLLLGCSPKPNINLELAEMARQDQLERTQGYGTVADDLIRLTRVQELEDSDRLQHALDFYNAALIFQHGTEPLHYLKAHLYSKEALKRDPNLVKARWLSCAAEDWYLLSIGKAQIWGTQYLMKGGKSREIRQPYHRWVKTSKERESCRS